MVWLGIASLPCSVCFDNWKLLLKLTCICFGCSFMQSFMLEHKRSVSSVSFSEELCSENFLLKVMSLNHWLLMYSARSDKWIYIQGCGIWKSKSVNVWVTQAWSFVWWSLHTCTCFEMNTLLNLAEFYWCFSCSVNFFSEMCKKNLYTYIGEWNSLTFVHYPPHPPSSFHEWEILWYHV